MKKKLLVLSTILLLTSACTAAKKDEASKVTSLNEGAVIQKDVTQKEFATQSLLGTVWVRNSGEYRALCYQAFNDGSHYFKEVASDKKMTGKRLAVVVDLDETMLDNSAYAAWQVVNGKGYSKESWERWVASEKATEVPGAVAFANTVVDNGGEIFYISNRSAKQNQSTINNMVALGFPMADNTHVLGKVDSSDKKARVDSVKAKGFTIVTFAGDNLDDFDSTVHRRLNTERKEHVNATKDEYGSRRIILPNPNYGGFDGGVAKDYYKLDLNKKNQARLEVIRPWDGK